MKTFKDLGIAPDYDYLKGFEELEREGGRLVKRECRGFGVGTNGAGLFAGTDVLNELCKVQQL